MTDDAPRGHDLREVLLRDVPIPLYLRTTEHHEGLKREFALLVASGGGTGVPEELLALVDELQRTFAAFTAAPEAVLQAAAARGDAAVDVRYEVPATVGGAAARFAEVLERADAYCAEGALLTVPPDPSVRAFRRWFLEEFGRQLAGEAPRPWTADLIAT